VTDVQLRTVLSKLRPRFRGVEPKINDLDHALRCWGASALFDDAECLSGAEMRTLLLDHREFSKAWPRSPPLLLDNGVGIRVRIQEGAATSSHSDHTLAGQAEIGTPLDFPVTTARRQTTLRAMLEQSLRDFSLNQGEYEWSALSYALYLPPTVRWISSEGQEITFDRIARRLMRQSADQGVCFGNHRLHALAVLLRVDDREKILSTDVREAILAHLTAMTARLLQNQHMDGYFNGFWAGEASSQEGGVAPDSPGGRLLATGHALEWWALAPADVHPPREALVRAGQWLARTIEGLSEAEVRSYFTFLTHAGRALALWRASEPADWSTSSAAESARSLKSQ
jgi:hypothetical protein